MILTATLKDENGATVGAIVLNAKTFASGSKGFFGQAKLELNSERYQVQCQAVRIGSKEEKP